MTKKELRKKQLELLKIPGVVLVKLGTKHTRGIDTGEPALVVGVEEKQNRSVVPQAYVIPSEVGGLPTDVQEVKPIVAFEVGRHRPAPAGVSIGHYAITAGTLGAVLLQDNLPVILSNNHVLANSNEASVGDRILQPGAHDGGTTVDTIGYLKDFEPVRFGGLPDECPFAKAFVVVLNLITKLIGSKTVYSVADAVEPNVMDAAVATPASPADVALFQVIHEAPITGTTTFAVGTKVRKTGRTTDTTRGQVDAEEVAVNVQYGAGKIAAFVGQLQIGPGGFSAGGDSGSAILTEEGLLGALLFAGSEDMTIGSPIGPILERFKLSL